MISYQIVKKPRLRAITENNGSSTSLVLVETKEIIPNPVEVQTPNPTMHMVHTIMHQRKGTGPLTEVKLLNYIDSLNFGVGNYIKFKNFSRLDKQAIHFVIGVQTNPEKVSLDRRGEPSCFLIAKAFPGGNGHEWVRWDSAEDYTTLTDEELRTYILPEDDFLQNRIQELQQKYITSQAPRPAC